MSLAAMLAEDRRLCILRLLRDAPGNQLNHYVLQTALDSVEGHKVSRDCVLGELAWLTEQGLVTCETVQTVTVAHLTGRGDDVAAGRCRAPGVKKPVPGE